MLGRGVLQRFAQRVVGQRACRQHDQRHAARSSAGPNVRTASCEAASTTTSGRRASSASMPITKGTPNSRGERLAARCVAAPDDRHDFDRAQIAGPDVLQTQAGDRAPADDADPHGCFLLRGFCHTVVRPTPVP